MALYAAVTALSAFLLFQVQLIIAKCILPWFGGTAGVWTTSVFFFQALLLAGYAFTHATGKLAPRARFRLQAALMIVSLALLAVHAVAWRSPITPVAAPAITGARPTLGLLLLLVTSVGLPFLLLSTTSPLLQDWYARSQGVAPYRLYALSNLGSLAGLLTYPFVVEPGTTLITQGWLWAIGYAAFVGGVIVCGLGASRIEPVPAAAESGPKKQRAKAPRAATTTWGTRPQVIAASWILLSAGGSSLMLATTNFLSQDVAAVPLLWVVPLSLYLISFIVTFNNDRFYRRGIFLPALGVAIAAMLYALFRSGFIKVRIEIWLYNLLLLAGCIVLHGELARLKPAAAGDDKRQLTRFYVAIALGGAVGSTFVALLAPHLLPDVWEFHISVFAAALLAVLAQLRDPDSWLRRAEAWKSLAAVTLAAVLPIVAAMEFRSVLSQGLRAAYWIALAVCALGAIVFRVLEDSGGRRRVSQAIAAGAAIVLGLTLYLHTTQIEGLPIARVRNFYGVARVVELDPNDPVRHAYELYHGRILHGIQMRAPGMRHRATSYYGNQSGAGLALKYQTRRWSTDPQQATLRVGVVGLGAGTLANYAVPGDYFRIYELNPQVAAFSQGAEPYFTSVRDCRGACEIVLGDARISMQREADSGQLQKFDVLVLDAFSGDAIPVHLLTRQAFELYFRHLRDDQSLIAIHVTNRVVNLLPVLAHLARVMKLEAIQISAPARGAYILETNYVLLKRAPVVLKAPPLDPGVKVTDLGPEGPLWTDDFSNIYSVLR
ncbi:MAG TPA: hypothetical protein VFA60_10485 [Terriglobales bacterium]|nr:hypothetical protein [Terriglobales bacterium]